MNEKPSPQKAELGDIAPEIPSPIADKQAKKDKTTFASKSELQRRRYRQETRRMKKEQKLELSFRINLRFHNFNLAVRTDGVVEQWGNFIIARTNDEGNFVFLL